MQWTIQNSDSQRFVKIICEGLFTVEDCLRIQDDLFARAFWKPGMNLLVDFFKANFDGLTLDDLRLLAELHRARNDQLGEGKIAVLMKTNRDYGVGRQYEMLSEPVVSSQMMIFRDVVEAINWLNADEQFSLRRVG